jgi:hypothetical protein
LLTPIELAPDPIARRSIWIGYALPGPRTPKTHDKAGLKWNRKYLGSFARKGACLDGLYGFNLYP